MYPTNKRNEGTIKAEPNSLDKMSETHLFSEESSDLERGRVTKLKNTDKAKD